MEHRVKLDVSDLVAIIDDDGSLSRDRIGRPAFAAGSNDQPTNRDITTNDEEWDTEELEWQR